MKQLAAPFKQLLDRKLWPLAVLLIAALVAAPMLLAKEPEAAPPVTAATGDPGPTAAIASVADEATIETNRKVLGSSKNPFRPAIKAVPAKVQESTDAEDGGATSTDGATSGDTSTGGTSSGGTGSETPSTPSTPETPETPEKTYEVYSLSVRFGVAGGELAKKELKRLTGLPGGARPALLYLGLKDDKKTAVFMVDATATVQGDGNCDPSPENCQTLELKAGETVFIDVEGGQQYELDLLKIHTKTTTDAEAATAARSAEAEGGRDYLRANASRVGRYRYSAGEGLLKVLSQKTWKATVASATGVSYGK